MENNVKLNVQHCVFTRNKALTDGGAIRVTEQVQIRVAKCTFQENSASQGGAIFRMEQSCNNQFMKVISQRTMVRGEETIHVTNGDFGKIQLFTHSCTFLEHFANDYGGAISGLYNRNIKIEKCTFSNNANKEVRSAIAVGWIENMLIAQYTFNNNTASQAGAMTLDHVKMIHLRNITFSENKALATDGGTISFLHSQIKFEECNFHESTAVGYGGAISGTESKSIIMQNSKFVKNEAGEGGAIFFEHIASLQINETRFVENRATLNGGAMALNLYISSEICNCLFSANIGGKGGAIIMDNYVHAILDSVIFLKNIARGSAGALGAEMGRSVLVNMRNISCVGNTAGLHGGCIESRNYAMFTIYDSKFSGNEAGIYGDAYAGVDTSIQVRKSVFFSIFLLFLSFRVCARSVGNCQSSR